MESVFDEDKKTYIISSHAKTRLAQRNRTPFSQSEERCLDYIHTGKLLLETDKYRYIKTGNLFFPYKKEGNVYTLTTVLLWDSMVEKRFQKVIDNYHSNTSH